MPVKSPGQRSARRANGLLIVLIGAAGTNLVVRSADHEPWQKVGVLVAFMVGAPVFVRTVWAGARKTPSEQSEGAKVGWGQAIFEWSLVGVMALLAFAFWLFVLQR